MTTWIGHKGAVFNKNCQSVKSATFPSGIPIIIHEECWLQICTYNLFPVGKSGIPIEISLKKAAEFAKHFCIKIAAYQNVSIVLVLLSGDPYYVSLE